MQNNKSLVQIFAIPEASSTDWIEFCPAGIPAGWVSRLLNREDLPSGGIERISLWRHDGGLLPYEPASTELVVIVQGRVQLTHIDGERYVIETGQVALIPAGFRGSWATQEPLVKLSAILSHH